MALALLRLRRAAALSRDIPFAYSVASSPGPLLPASAAGSISSPPTAGPALRRPHSLFQSLSFRSSAPFSINRTGGGIEDKIGPDEILFEGCDYNHWLITMDFPKDPAPTREEMIETYIQTLAKVVGSVEEAKKRMYALSTTTYHGFQAVMTEEMSEKFRGLPGVVFILPDSYIDPVNKEYGGDKYDNGVITPRPPPIQYGRQGRVRSQNRYDRPNYNRPPSQGNMPNNQQGSREGDGWNYPSQQNYSQPGQYGRGYDAPGGRDFPSGERRDFGQVQRNYAQSAVRDGYHSEPRDSMPSYQRNFGQVDRDNLHPQEQRNYTRGPGGQNMYYNNSGYGDNRQGVAPGYSGEHRQSVNSGYGGENNGGGGSGYGGNYRQGQQGSAYEPNHSGPPDGQQGSAYEPNHSGPPDGQQGSWQGRQ